MARKSAHMLRRNMTVVIDGHQQVITNVVIETNNERVVIYTDTGVYYRPPGVKIEVVRSDR